ncbi:argininosuccinate lyase [Candidatus Aerophobetes bacterium]|nr:argininosuccinate lyase [Candidatus Aerophobetes bacterium]
MSLWGGRFKESIDKLVEDFTSSIKVDKKLYKYDIEGSIAHTKMLLKGNIINEEEAEKIITTLKEIEKDIRGDKVNLLRKEDIHMAIEEELIKRIGDIGKKLHTARSRNDQIALDERLYQRDKIKELSKLIFSFQEVLLEIAERNQEIIIPGFTHLQYAQPLLLAHYFLAYFWMFQRDRERLGDVYKRMNVMPLGSCALAGTSLPIDRKYGARLLGFSKISPNSLDAVSDRDYIIEFLASLSILMMHLSRLSEEIVIWVSPPFSFIEIRDAFTTGSSIMPQKKNPDVVELIRGKTGHIYGNLFSILTTMKALPLSYNRDMQEDKKPLFESVDIVKGSLKIFIQLLKNIKINKKRMREEAEKGFFAATDLTDYLVEKKVPFRNAHRIVGEIVKYCLEKGKSFKSLTLKEYQSFSSLFKGDIFDRLKLDRCVFSKESPGGTGKKALKEQIDLAKQVLKENFRKNNL